jgi:hypothetical protein
MCILKEIINSLIAIYGRLPSRSAKRPREHCPVGI